jgi:hypothetical protein
MRRALALVLILVVCIPAFAQGQAPAVTTALLFAVWPG